jgi:hypothetical protein
VLKELAKDRKSLQMFDRSYLKAKEVIAARATPLDRVTVSNISAGIIQARERDEHFSNDRELLEMLTKGTHAGESKIENPCHDDKAPMCT